MRKKTWTSYKHLRYDKHKMVGEHKIIMPELPEDPSEVFFIDEDEDNAFWQRDIVEATYRPIWFNFIPHYTKMWQDATLEDDRGALSHVNQEDSQYIIDTIQKEVRRRSEGVHIRIKDEIVWITGDMWFVLMWCKTKRPDGKSYFDFRFFQLDFFYLVYHTIISEHILGLFISKPKKTGITNLMWLIYLNRVTMTKNINVGAMNIDQDKCAKTFRDYFMYAFNNMVPILKPQVKTVSEADGKITFGKKGGSRKGSAGFNDADDELGSSVISVPCAIHAFDVDVFKLIYYDEPPKYKNDFGEVYRSNSAGTSIQDYIVGKIFLTSYTPEDSGQSFMAAKELFYDSELRTIPEGGKQTKSKLICYHIPSHKSWWTSFDKYGHCNEKEAIEKIMSKRATLKDRPKELQAEIRKYAIDKKEAWMVGGAGSIFDPIRVSEIEEEVLREQRESPTNPYTPGNLKWANESWNVNPNLRGKGKFCPVYFEPLTEDELMRDEPYTFREYYKLPQDQINLPLSLGRDEHGNVNRPPLFKSVIGADPTQHAAGSEVIEGSTNSYLVLSRADEVLDMQKREVASRLFMYEYYFRHESPDDSYEDLVKLLIYTGALAAVEANAPTMATALMAEGLGNYMLVRDLKGNAVIWEAWMGMHRDPEKKYHLLRTTANSKDGRNVLEEFVRLWKAYIRRPFPGGKDYGMTIKSERITKDLRNIDIKESTKKFDTFMAGGWALWADEMYSLILMYENENEVSPNDTLAILKALAPKV